MAKFKINVEGFECVKRKLDEAPQILFQEASSIIYETAVEIENKAKSRVKVDTSALRSSIRATKLSNGSSMIKAGLSNVSNSKGHLINYAAFVEFGTGRGFGIPPYKFSTKKPLGNFASQFRGSGLRNYNMPNRPFFFKTFDEKYATLLKTLKSYKVR